VLEADPDEPVRIHVVQHLVESRLLKGDPPDDATEEEHRLAATYGAEVAGLYVEAGFLPPSVTVMDMSLEGVQSLAAAYSSLMRWWPQPGMRDKSLGAVLKVVPQESAAWAVMWLRWAGWLPPEDEPEDPGV